ncbi:MAG: Nif11-like leader peptide family natural product precursor [Candidatus Hydrogenedentota bacterium]
MTVQNAKAFIEHVGKHPELQDRLNALTGRGTLDRLAEIGREEGYEFTAQDYREAVIDMAAGELSPEALDRAAREMGLEPPGEAGSP